MNRRMKKAISMCLTDRNFLDACSRNKSDYAAVVAARYLSNWPELVQLLKTIAGNSKTNANA